MVIAVIAVALSSCGSDTATLDGETFCEKWQSLQKDNSFVNGGSANDAKGLYTDLASAAKTEPVRTAALNTADLLGEIPGDVDLANLSLEKQNKVNAALAVLQNAGDDCP